MRVRAECGTFSLGVLLYGLLGCGSGEAETVAEPVEGVQATDPETTCDQVVAEYRRSGEAWGDFPMGAHNPGVGPDQTAKHQIQNAAEKLRAKCLELPPRFQKCMVPSYRGVHIEECGAFGIAPAFRELNEKMNEAATTLEELNRDLREKQRAKTEASEPADVE